MVLPNSQDRNDSGDRHGFDENRSYISAFFGKLIPQWLARRAIDVRVSTDKRRYDQGEPVQLTIEFRNRLPVPIAVTTPRQRLWGWTVDGELAASDERVYRPDNPSAFAFRPREVKRIRREWSGRFERTGGERIRWIEAEPGTYEIRAFVASKGYRASDSMTIDVTRRP